MVFLFLVLPNKMANQVQDVATWDRHAMLLSLDLLFIWKAIDVNFIISPSFQSCQRCQSCRAIGSLWRKLQCWRVGAFIWGLRGIVVQLSLFMLKILQILTRQRRTFRVYCSNESCFVLGMALAHTWFLEVHLIALPRSRKPARRS